MPVKLRHTFLGSLALLVQCGIGLETSVAQPEPAPRANESSQEIDRLEVSALIRQLGSSTRTIRTAAEKKLISFGPELLDLLPSPDLIRSVAARQAVRRIRIRLENDAARASLQPGVVTLRGRYSIAEILQALRTQTGNQIRLKESKTEDGLLKEISVDWSSTSFWAALDRLEQSGWVARFEAGSGALVMSFGEQSRRVLTRTDRAFRIRASPFQSRATNESSSFLRNRVSIECEPRLRPLFLNYASDDFSLRIGGSSVPSFSAGAKIEIPLGVAGREAVIQSGFLVNSPADSATLNGKVSLLLAAAERPIEFSQLKDAAGVARRRGGVTAIVSSVRFDRNTRGHSARVLVRVSYDLGINAFESHQTWVFHNRAWLADPSEKNVAAQRSPTSFETVFQNEAGVGVEYVFERLDTNPADMKFVYLAPTQLIRVPLKIEFENLPVEADSESPAVEEG